MTKIDDGGPAFPNPMNRDDRGTAFPQEYGYGGMSLRDWFAGQAMVGILARGWDAYQSGSPETLAADCYAMSDAMLAAREEEQ